MAETSKDSQPINVEADSSKSPQDLESEIAQTAAALGGKSKKENAAASEDVPVKEVSAKPEPAKKTEAPAESQEITVKTAKRVEEAPADQVKEKADEEAGKVEKAASHSGKTLQPITAKADDVKKTEKGDNAVDKTAEAESKENSKKPDDDSEEDSEAAHKLAAMSGELRSRESEKKAAAEREQQVAKIYDTKKYHLPIKAGHHHRKAMMPLWAQILVLLIALAGAAYYAYATDIISFGETTSFLDNQTQTTGEERPVAVTPKTGVSVFDLIEGAEAIGSADVKASIYYGQSGDGELITQDFKLEQNSAGTFWLNSDTAALKTNNDLLRASEVKDSKLATAQQAIDLIDIYNLSYLITDSGPGSLPSYLEDLSGNQAVSCQQAIDSAIIFMSDNEFNTAVLEVYNQITTTRTVGGNELEFSSFSLKGEVLASAQTVVASAITSCVSNELAKTQLQDSLWQDEDIVFQTASDDGKHYIRVENKAIDRTVIDLRVSNVQSEISQTSPQTIMSYNTAVNRQVAAIKLCKNSLPLQLVESGDQYQLIDPQDDDYRSIAPLSIALVCSDSTEQVSNLESDENLYQRALDTLSLRSLIESISLAQTDFPSEAELSAATEALDDALPDVATSQIFTYIVLPDGCGDDIACTSYALNVAQ